MAKVYSANLSSDSHSGGDSLRKILNNLSKELSKITDATSEGLVKAMMLVRYQTEVSAPKTPVDLGNLRASFFIVSDKHGQVQVPETGNFVNYAKDASVNRPGVKRQYKASELRAMHSSIISACSSAAKAKGKPNVYSGYSAAYAWFVHEMQGVTFHREGAEAKWFEKTINRLKKDFVKIVRDNVVK